MITKQEQEKLVSECAEIQERIPIDELDQNTQTIKNSVGCSISGEFTEQELSKFKGAGWMTEEEYFKLHPKER